MPFPHCYRCAFGQSYPGCDFLCVEHLRGSLETTIPAEEVAALITEPLQGNAGYIIPPPEYHRMLVELCGEHGWLFIADEIQSGLGRSGKMFAIEHWGVTPDVICVAKALAGGMVPMGAMVARSEVMDWTPGAHATTFGGNLLACAAALAGLRVIRRGRLMARAAKLGKLALSRLQELAEHPLVGEVRGLGLMLAVELVRDKRSKKPAIKERDAIMRAALDRGVILFRGGRSSIRIAPPLIIGQSELELGLDRFEEALREVR